MGLTLLFIAICIGLGGVAALSGRGPINLPDVPKPFTDQDLRQFSPKQTLFIIGPAANHPACRLQRRLLKPAIAMVIREDITIMEIYGEDAPRKNGDVVDWLDPALLRHAMDAEEGFFVIYMNAAGKVAFRSEAPMVAADIFAKAGISAEPTSGSASRDSVILSKLRAA